MTKKVATAIDPSASAANEARRREQIRLRMQRYRASIDCKRRHLEAEIRHLNNELDRLQSAPRKARPTAYAVAAQVLHQHTATLRENVNRRYKLAHLLYYWVASQEPCEGLPAGSSWLETTLLAEPVAREQGYHWLSQRLYHSAIAATINTSTNECFNTSLYTGDDDKGLSLKGIHIQMQTTVAAPFAAVAKSFWRANCESMAEATEIEKVDDRLLYYNRMEEDHKAFDIIAMFEDPTRVVITSLGVPHDERYPIVEGEMRCYGTQWVVVERLTETTTRVQYTWFSPVPLLASGPAPLVQVGRICGLSSHGIDYREAYIERIRAYIDKCHAPIQEKWFRQCIQDVPTAH
ncbi:Aste57867_1490 [Aphanomyces stellatus]|uniref:Aste57867_1490 protein n=1 Tax=Aphanomyces stellatus TaxID=120398 RepID=A0A485K5E7_9STRA|nr:hypothetical protein As57867_001489 [Aphanomyces stellatus]VFT78706.1 Aste57867_1490 [Aphanomyces stellatus]